VVGYIAFIDPQTGQRWIPKGETGALQGYPREISVVFRSKADGREHRVNIENWAGNVVFRDAVKYEIAFTHSDFSETPALLGRSGAGGGPRQIQFHFDRWRYDRVEAGPWRLFSGGRETPVPLTRRASPFPDLH
jgi:hypothetical protein